MGAIAPRRPTAEDIPLSFAVIIPCHNVETTLAEQLEALTRQTWTDTWGILVVDNRSTDGTRALALGYRDKGVRVVEAYEGRGVAYARNAGVRQSNARTFAFCDGDDVVHSGWVTAMADALSGAELASGQLETKTLNPSWLADSRPMGGQSRLPTFGSLGFASGCNCGMTRELFDRLGGFDEDFVGLEDIEFSLRALGSGTTVRLVPDALVAYRFRDQLSSVWHQGVFYGRGRPELKRRARKLGLPFPGVLESLKSWAWLVVHLPDLRHRSGRYKWTWVLANRLGVIRGHVEDVKQKLSSLTRGKRQN